MQSPFTCVSSVVRLPPIRPGQNAKIVIRLANDDATNQVLFNIDSAVDVDNDHAAGYLLGGESVEISAEAVNLLSDISFLNTVNDPLIYVGIL